MSAASKPIIVSPSSTRLVAAASACSFESQIESVLKERTSLHAVAGVSTSKLM